MKVECYGATRPRDGATANEDALWIWRPSSIVAAVCDGAGHAQQCATQVIRMFARLTDFADLPATLIDLAGKHGRADDMTVVALRRR